MGGDQKGPSILLKFEYSNKQDALIPNMTSKITNRNKIKSSGHFKLQNFEKLGLTFLAKNSKKDTHQSRLLDVGNEKSFKIKLFQKIQCQFQKYQNIESLK